MMRSPFPYPLLLTLWLAGGAWARDSPVEVLDPGTGSMQVAVDGGTIHVLKSNGQIWAHQAGRWSRRVSFEGLRMIAVGGGHLYGLHVDGRIFTLEGRRFRTLDDSGDVRQIDCDPDGALFVLKENGNVWRRVGDRFQRLSSGTGTRAIAAARSLYLLQNSDEIYRSDGDDQWTRVDRGGGTRQMVADGELLYVLKQDGKIWRRKDGDWELLHQEPGTDQIAARDGYLYAVKRQGQLWSFEGASGTRLPDAPLTRQIAAQGRRVLVLRETGNLLAVEGPVRASDAGLISALPGGPTPGRRTSIARQ